MTQIAAGTIHRRAAATALQGIADGLNAALPGETASAKL